jgi:hypothetical protein
VNCARDDWSVHPDDCGVALMQSFKDFEVEHSIKSTKENKINYVYFGVKIKNLGNVGVECINEFSTEFSYDNVSHVNVTAGGAFAELTNSNVAKKYKI